jgi:hypothetical protein
VNHPFYKSWEDLRYFIKVETKYGPVVADRALTYQSSNGFHGPVATAEGELMLKAIRIIPDCKFNFVGLNPYKYPQTTDEPIHEESVQNIFQLYPPRDHHDSNCDIIKFDISEKDFKDNYNIDWTCD